MKDFLQWAMAIIALLFICFLGSLVFSHPQSGQSGLINFARNRQGSDGPTLPVTSGLTQCEGAPFIVPTDGWIGVLYGDSILGTVNHSGLDIFGLDGNGVTPVYAAYNGYLTRLPEWTSAVIIRHPEDPLAPDRQIWTYYTHMADGEGNSYILSQIPPGTYELPVKQGTLLGYQGDYTSQSWRPIDTHLHFSLVLDNGNGQFLNETDIANTIDPSPYLGMRLNSRCGDRPPVCRPDVLCP
jgi:hypothetical protein